MIIPRCYSHNSTLMMEDMQLKIFMCSVGEEAELCFYLYHRDGRHVSEEYVSQSPQ